MNFGLGVTLVVAGILLDTLGFVREDIVAAAGAIVVVTGFVGILVVLVKGMPTRANVLGLGAIVLGTLLIVHDVLFIAIGLAPLAPVVHATLGVFMVLLGVFQVLGRSKLVDWLGQMQTA